MLCGNPKMVEDTKESLKIDWIDPWIAAAKAISPLKIIGKHLFNWQSTVGKTIWVKQKR